MFIYWWSEELMLIKLCNKHLNMCNDTMIDWNHYIQGICAKQLIEQTKGWIDGKDKLKIDKSILL